MEWFYESRVNTMKFLEEGQVTAPFVLDGTHAIFAQETGCKVVSKIKAAVDARIDSSMFIIARTGSLAVGGWDEAEARISAYVDACADMAFID